ncbi:MAG: Hsp70 family protein, partial [Bacteroidetes bacterium]|nr:Hsp70 family protein [Bacteroidota bacterium]
SILVHTFKGENSNVQFNTSIDSFTIADLPPKPANQTGIEVTFSMTKEGVLTVKARSLDTGNQMESTYHLENLVH